VLESKGRRGASSAAGVTRRASPPPRFSVPSALLFARVASVPGRCNQPSDHRLWGQIRWGLGGWSGAMGRAEASREAEAALDTFRPLYHVLLSLPPSLSLSRTHTTQPPAHASVGIPRTRALWCTPISSATYPAFAKKPPLTPLFSVVQFAETHLCAGLSETRARSPPRRPANRIPHRPADADASGRRRAARGFCLGRRPARDLVVAPRIRACREQPCFRPLVRPPCSGFCCRIRPDGRQRRRRLPRAAPSRAPPPPPVGRARACGGPCRAPPPRRRPRRRRFAHPRVGCRRKRQPPRRAPCCGLVRPEHGPRLVRRRLRG
jgi:hypothetical protein